MSVEKMAIMNIIGRVEDVDYVLKDILNSGKVDLVDAMTQIEENNFLFDVSDDNIDRLLDLNNITTFNKDERYDELLKKGENLKVILGIDQDADVPEAKIEMNSEDILKELESICDKTHEPNTQLEALNKELDYLENFYANSFKELKEFSVPIGALRDMEYFNFKMGILTKEDRNKLKKNYENILAIILHTGTSADGEVYFVLYPATLEEEMKRILRSLNFREINIPQAYSGTPVEIRDQILKNKERLREEIEGQESKILEIKNKYSTRIHHLISQVKLLSKLDEIKEKIAFSKRFFYMSGWVAKSDKAEMTEILGKNSETLVIFKDETTLQPPTKLKNNWFFEPFEWLVNLYGTPRYNELDPTPFVSLSYMLLFGIMFGDLGQGIVFIIAGYFLSKKMRLFGGLISRLGIASSIFGILYGAVFGIETILPTIWMKPFENVNDILMFAIGVGIFVLLVAYVFGIINALKRKDIEEGYFGHAGIAGLILYVTMLILVGGGLLGIKILPTPVGVGIAILALLAIVFRLPLTHLIEGKRPLHGGDVSGYYVEAVFSLIETFLAMLSGTVSFIRVGAFALTHVGLFLAFETIGHMMGSAAGNIIMMVVGNIFIIGLEGLIVFIQGMRLQYYELFSRYYQGDGREFNPISLKN
ncbi:MAG: V-type ATPase 116kDa subunit family protein [Gudongella sp.]|jgi:V/A-type H+-transporting ATPase subunit I|nr:V-type ATPase 116kDa subunit family protein [Gudongella sp.]